MHESDLPPRASSVFSDHFERLHRRRTGFLVLVLTPIFCTLLAILVPIAGLSGVQALLFVHTGVPLAGVVAILATLADLRTTHVFAYNLSDDVDATLHAPRYDPAPHRDECCLLLHLGDARDIVLQGYQPAGQERMIVTSIAPASEMDRIPTEKDDANPQSYAYQTATKAGWES